MHTFCAKRNVIRRVALLLLCLWALLLVSPHGLHATDKKKKKGATPPAAEEKKPQQDLSKLVWPEPPNIARVRYTSYFAGMPYDKSLDTKNGKKPKQTWMDRLAGTQSQDEKITVKNFPFQLLGPYGMAVDSKGRLYVADQKVGAIFIFNTDTKETEMIRNGFEAHFGLINSVAVDDGDRVFVSDGKLGKVLVFNAKHQIEDQIKDLVDPVGLAIDKENRLLYVVDTQQDQVLVYDADTLKPLRRIGTGGKKHTLTTPGDFALPSDIAVDKDGNVYVTDTLNWRVEIFDAEGNFISQFGKHCDAIGCFQRPKGIAVDSDGHVWVVDTSLNLVESYTRNGELLGYVGGPGRLLGQFTDPTGIFIDQNNRMFVSEQYPWGRVQEFRYITDAEADQLKKEKEAQKSSSKSASAAPAPVQPGTEAATEVKK
jgi:DNA-binding beta-propeller fold protein YncE